MRGFALFCACLALAGCSLFLSTSDYAGADPTGVATPDASEASDAPAPPPADEGGLADGNRPDAPGDAFCASLNPKPKFCADFESAAVSDGWDTVFIDPDAVGAVTKTPTGGLSTKITGSTGCSYARVEKKLPVSGAGVRVAFAMKPIVPFDADRIFFFARLNGGAGCAILFHVSPTDAHLHEQYGAPEQNDIWAWDRHPAIGTWTNIGVDFQTNAIAIDVDGMPASTHALSDGCAYGNQLIVGFGFHCAAGSFEMQYDNIVVDYP